MQEPVARLVGTCWIGKKEPVARLVGTCWIGKKEQVGEVSRNLLDRHAGTPKKGF